MLTFSYPWYRVPDKFNPNIILYLYYMTIDKEDIAEKFLNYIDNDEFKEEVYSDLIETKHDKIYPSEEFKNKYIGKDNVMWSEFLNMYPEKTPGGRMLKDKLVTAKKKYLSLVKKNYKLHLHILSCLECEVFQKKESGNLEYMSSVSNYVKEEKWKVYEGELMNYLARKSTIEDMEESRDIYYNE